MSEYMEDKMYIILNRVRQRPGMRIDKLDIERLRLLKKYLVRNILFF